jgi:streptogramin lyase
MTSLFRAAAALASAAILGVIPLSSASAASCGCQVGAVISYPPPASTDAPFGVTEGPGGEWYAHGNTIDRIRHGQLERFAIPDAAADAGWLVWDHHSRYVWFADRGTGRLGTVDAHDNVHEFQIPAGTAGAAVPQGIVLGPGPFVWFTDQVNDRIGRLDVRTGGMSFTTTPNPGGTPLGLTRGEDGALWFTERSADVVGRLAPNGTFTQWQLAADSFPNRIVDGPDGAIWFTELHGGKLGRIAHGSLTEFPVSGGPVGITVGPDHRLYVAMWSASQVAQVSTDGVVTKTWSVPGALQVAVGRHSIWATDPFANAVSETRLDC